MMIQNKLQGRLEKNFPLQSLTTWKIGGPGEYVFWPHDIQDMVEVLRDCKEKNIPVWVIGRGSNLLISDRGLPGVTVVSTALKGINWADNTVRVEAGYSLARLAQEAGERGLSGLEFARGIPGTVGGAVIMNAGAHGGEIGERILTVNALWNNGEICRHSKNDLKFGYRECSLRHEAWILEVEFSLMPGNKEEILEKMRENLARRAQSQPLELPNAGSVFRNPIGDSAGRLIESAGWKGYQNGGAKVSEKHANFIVNTGGATAENVISLIKMIQKDIKTKFGVELKPEIQYLTPEGVK